MADTHSKQVKPERTVPLRLEVLRRAQVSPHIARVTLGGGEIDRFTHRGRDQWFRLFLPPVDGVGMKLPDRDGWGGYFQLRTTARSLRPTMRNYTVRGYRAATAERGAELDVDFVLHASPETGEVEGLAATWATRCTPGDAVGLLDEGYGFDPAPDAAWFLLVADETGLPAVAGACAALPADARGLVFVELPAADDAQDFPVPEGVEVHWLPRTDGERIGSLAYAAVVAARMPGDTADPGHPAPVRHAFAVGEQALATGIRRHLVGERGWPKESIDFCGYWRLPKDAPAIDGLEAPARRAA
ncbi:siderophore-interacting protein [Agromyces mangrovi Wang et al. 2018]|uniref:siderophore-interacting protein n=1 Tax=Agromyces mangrovi TaxID=1858653 RepID=UPI002573BFE8|nr:siderophore-interacting protein [Agromyces mangrovi]BDZ64193.1 siderophore-interacting protein [Agromyces mangrovi]